MTRAATIRILLPTLAGLLLLAPAAWIGDAKEPDPSPIWTQDGTPAATAVQSVGGADGVLIASTFANGAYRSTDGGLHWVPIPGFPVVRGRVAFDASVSGLGYVAGYGGVARTLDGGLSWSLVYASARAARIDVGPGGIVLIGTHEADGTNHAVRSVDHGATWVDLAAPMPSQQALCGVAFGADEQQLMVMTNFTSFFSADGGTTWTETNGSALDFAIEATGVVWRSGLNHLERTHDGGATWESVQPPAFGIAVGPRAGSGVYLATPIGLLRTRDGTAWDNLGFADAMAKVHGLAPDPLDPEVEWITDEVVGIARVSPSAGGVAYEGRTTGLPPVAVNTVGGSPDGSLLVAAGPGGIYASRDGGLRWAHTGAGYGRLALDSVAVSPEGLRILVGGRNFLGGPEVLFSGDGGATFAAVELGFLLPDSGTVRGLAFGAEGRVDAALRGDHAAGQVATSGDGGATWTSLLDLPGAAIQDLAWWAPGGTLLVASDVGLLAYDAPGAWSARGPAGLAVASRGTWALASVNATGALWRSLPGLPTPILIPWTETGAVAHLAAAPDGAWAVTAGGDLLRCAGRPLHGDCADAGPPATVRAVWDDAPHARVVAATDTGVWRGS